MSSGLAILLFAMSPQVDEKRTLISSRERQGNALEHLHRHTLKTIRNSGIPFILSDETNQIGQTLSQRLTNAVKARIEEGYSELIIIGNDTPNLSVQHLEHAASVLKAGHEVLGPSLDGGNYLIGINAERFDAQLFEAALEDPAFTHQRLSILLENTEVLEGLRDIDDSQSLKAWLYYDSPRVESLQLTKILKSLFSGSTFSIENLNFLSYNLVLDSALRRGPPSLN